MRFFYLRIWFPFILFVFYKIGCFNDFIKNRGAVPFIQSIGRTLRICPDTENKTKVPSFFRNNEIIVSTRKEITIPVTPSYSFLLKEDGFYLLKEDGFKIILD